MLMTKVYRLAHTYRAVYSREHTELRRRGRASWDGGDGAGVAWR